MSSLTNIESRATMDLDVTIKNIELSKEKVAGYLNHIISIPTRNNLEMAVLGVDTIHEAADYPGFRVTLVIHYETLKETIKIDFTTGDPTTPSEVNFAYQTLVDRCNLSLTAYNLETLL